MLLYKSRQRRAGVAELADALDSGSSGSNLVEVQVLSPAFSWIQEHFDNFEMLFFLFSMVLRKIIGQLTSEGRFLDSML